MGVGKKEAVTEGDWGGTGVPRKGSCKWFRTYGSLLTMEGKFQRGSMEGWDGGIQEDQESSERMKEPRLGQGDNCLLRTPSFMEMRDMIGRPSKALTEAQAISVLVVPKGPDNGWFSLRRGKGLPTCSEQWWGFPMCREIMEALTFFLCHGFEMFSHVFPLTVL